MGVLQVPPVHVGTLPPSSALRLGQRLISIVTTDGLQGPQYLTAIALKFLPYSYLAGRC